MEANNGGYNGTSNNQLENVKKDIKLYIKPKIKREKIAADIKFINECQKTNVTPNFVKRFFFTLVGDYWKMKIWHWCYIFIILFIQFLITIRENWLRSTVYQKVITIIRCFQLVGHLDLKSPSLVIISQFFLLIFHSKVSLFLSLPQLSFYSSVLCGVNSMVVVPSTSSNYIDNGHCP